MDEYKVFNDPVHSHIKLHPLCVKIMDTPEFQRLRNIKQVGPLYYVYPGGSHNRFEHSLGVCYLAGQMVEALRRNSPEEEITDDDKLCVEVAGLCHDLGHGPFSHTWERFAKKANPSLPKWKHESSSLAMFDELIVENRLEDEIKRNLKEYDCETFVQCVKDMIQGEQKNKNQHKGKEFLYQIVSNKRNGIDVDRWDYFLRDGQQLNIKFTFDYRRLLEFSRILPVEGEKLICFRKKEASHIYEMFVTRAMLHHKAYRHPVCEIIEEMMIEAFIKAKDFPIGAGEESKKLSEAHTNIKCLKQMTDHIFYNIIYSSEDKYKDSRLLLERILKRDVYRTVARMNFSKDLAEATRQMLNKSSEEIENKSAEEIGAFVEKKINDFETKLNECVTEVLKGKQGACEEAKFKTKMIAIDLGIEMAGASAETASGNINPFSNVYFFEKKSSKPIKMDWKDVTPMPVSEESIWRLEGIVYYKKDPNEEVKGLEDFGEKLEEEWNRN